MGLAVNQVAFGLRGFESLPAHLRPAFGGTPVGKPTESKNYGLSYEAESVVGWVNPPK